MPERSLPPESIARLTAQVEPLRAVFDNIRRADAELREMADEVPTVEMIQEHITMLERYFLNGERAHQDLVDSGFQESVCLELRQLLEARRPYKDEMLGFWRKKLWDRLN